MKAFLEEYGLIVVVVIVIAALLGVGIVVSTSGSKQMENTYNAFSDKANEAMSQAGINISDSEGSNENAGGNP